MNLSTLQKVLSASVKRKGEVPLTNLHLLNIVKMAQRLEAMQDEQLRIALAEDMGDDMKWGSS